MLGQEFNFKVSKQYVSLVAVVFLMADIVVISLALSFWIKVALVMGVSLYGFYTLFQYALLWNKSSVRALRYLGDNSWILVTGQGSLAVELVKDSTATPWISVLRFKRPDKFLPISCVVFKDSMPEDQYRALIQCVSG